MKARKRISKLFKALKIAKLPYLPFVLGIEPGNICNLRCPLCPTGSGEKGLIKGFIGFGLFKDIFDQLKGSLEAINLYNWGEPLLNLDLPKMIRYAKDAKPRVRIVTSTNLNINDKKVMDGLLGSGIDEVIVSCDGATKDTYNKYRVGGDFNLVLDNLRYLAKRKKELLRDTLIIWNFLVFKHNEHEVEKAQEMAKDIGLPLRIGLMRTSMKDEILKPHKEAIKRDLDWIPDNPLYSAYNKESLAPKKVIRTCRKLWQEISVNWDGLVFPCCAVYGESFSFGDARKDSIRNIWNNEKFAAARIEILNKNIAACTICGRCRNNGFMHM